MTKLGFAIILACNLLFLGCYSGDDDSSRYIRLQISDAVVVENEENFVVGDTVFYEIRFSRYLEEEGYDNLLDIYETTGADEFYYSYGLNKLSSFTNNYERINIDSNFIIIEDGGQFGVSAVLNDEQTEYVSRVGIVLQEEGDYRFDFDYLDFYSEYVSGKVQVDIEHEVLTTAIEDFEFTVTE